MEDKWYKKYTQLNGNHDKNLFLKNLNIFFELTEDAYTSGIGSKKKAWIKWKEYIKDDAEAYKYFEAVDSVTAYT